MKATLPSTPIMHILPFLERVIVLDDARIRGKRLMPTEGSTSELVVVTDALGSTYRPGEFVECDRYTPTYAPDEEIATTMLLSKAPVGSHILKDGTIQLKLDIRIGGAFANDCILLKLDGTGSTTFIYAWSNAQVIDLSKTHLIIEP